MASGETRTRFFSSASSRSRKCSTSRGMSSLRSREGRQLHRDDVEAVVEVLAERPVGDRLLEIPVGGGDDRGRRPRSARSRRRGGTCRSSSTRSRSSWSLGEMSPISSRKSVPPCADSNLPLRRAIAPVKAPFSWPNSSLSSSVSVRAAQFMATNGPSAAAALVVDGRGRRPPCRCRSRRGRGWWSWSGPPPGPARRPAASPRSSRPGPGSGAPS